MAQPSGTFRPIPDVEAETERLAAHRASPPPTQVRIGDTLQCGAVTGRVSAVTLSPGGRFMVVCEPA